MSHRHGSIPPEENLHLYVEYHAMMAAAGELVDLGQPILTDIHGFGGDDPWRDWLESHLPNNPGLWLADLRSPVPADADLFGDLPPLDQWDVPSLTDYDHALGLADGQLPDQVVVAGHTDLHRRGARGTTYIKSALVIPDHADDLQRALAAATNPHDWKLPYENEEEFEVHHGRFDLSGWLTETVEYHEVLDEHDPYAHELRASRYLPGCRFRATMHAAPDPTGLTLLAHDRTVLARVDQWADPESNDKAAVTSSGYRTSVDRTTLLRYLTVTGTNLILEVQIGRHRSDAGHDGYRPPHSRIYLIDATGHITAR